MWIPRSAPLHRAGCSIESTTMVGRASTIALAPLLTNPAGNPTMQGLPFPGPMNRKTGQQGHEGRAAARAAKALALPCDGSPAGA